MVSAQQCMEDRCADVFDKPGDPFAVFPDPAGEGIRFSAEAVLYSLLILSLN